MENMRNFMELSFKIISFEDFRIAMQQLWPWQEKHIWIPFISNPTGIIQYYGKELFEKIITFPVAAILDGKEIGWTSTYNISDTHIRVRGLYVKPEYRGMHVGPKMLDYSLSLWPKPWNTCIGIWRKEAFEKLEKYWRLTKYPDQEFKPWMGDGYKYLTDIVIGYKKFNGN